MATLFMFMLAESGHDLKALLFKMNECVGGPSRHPGRQADAGGGDAGVTQTGHETQGHPLETPWPVGFRQGGGLLGSVAETPGRWPS